MSKDFDTRFQSEIANHEMHIIRDDGLHRHVRFKRAGTMCMHFDLITWPGHLCYTGDMGTYVFERIEDMFQFFRGNHVNLGYWAEKVQASDRDGIKRFSEQKFERKVKDYVLQWVRDNREDTTRQERRELWDAVMNEVVHADGDSDGARKQIAAHDFSHTIRRGWKFYFQDFWECNCDEFTHRFVWCCHAMQWGIAKYDAYKAPAEMAVV